MPKPLVLATDFLDIARKVIILGFIKLATGNVYAAGVVISALRTRSWLVFRAI